MAGYMPRQYTGEGSIISVLTGIDVEEQANHHITMSPESISTDDFTLSTLADCFQTSARKSLEIWPVSVVFTEQMSFMTNQWCHSTKDRQYKQTITMYSPVLHRQAGSGWLLLMLEHWLVNPGVCGWPSYKADVRTWQLGPLQSGPGSGQKTAIIILTYNMAVVGWLEFNVPFQHKCGYIRDEIW